MGGWHLSLLDVVHRDWWGRVQLAVAAQICPQIFPCMSLTSHPPIAPLFLLTPSSPPSVTFDFDRRLRKDTVLFFNSWPLSLSCDTRFSPWPQFSSLIENRHFNVCKLLSHSAYMDVPLILTRTRWFLGSWSCYFSRTNWTFQTVLYVIPINCNFMWCPLEPSFA